VFIFLSNLLELLQISKCLVSIGTIHIKSGEEKKGKMLLCLWASPLPHLAQLGNMVQPALTSRPMDEAGEVLPWHAGGGGRPIPARAGDKVAGKLF
jgi:hypothetical protein